MPTPSQTVSTYIKLKIRVNYRDGGWTETYNTTSTTFADCQAKWSNLLYWRAYCLPFGFTLIPTTMSQAGKTGDGYPFYAPPGNYVGDRLGDDAGAFNVANAGCNDDNTCLLYRLDTGQGLYANDWLRGVRDWWVLDDTIQFTLPSIYGTAVGAITNVATQVLPPGGQDGTYNTNITTQTSSSSYLATPNGQVGGFPLSATVINNWFSIVRDFTALYRPSVATPGSFDQYRFNSAPGNWFYRRVSERTAGKRYAFSRAKAPVMA